MQAGQIIACFAEQAHEKAEQEVQARHVCMFCRACRARSAELAQNAEIGKMAEIRLAKT